MDDLVAQKLRADLDEATKQHMPAMVVTTDYLRATLDSIQALEAERDALKRQLEAKAKLTITDVRVGPPIYNPSTALETGEWKK